MFPNIDVLVPQVSITEEYSPKYRKVAGLKKEAAEATIAQNHSSVMDSLSKLQLYFNDRMNFHEKELMQIMRLEIARILQDLKKVISVYNKMISQKNLSQDLWETRNQMEYFKFQSVRLFKENMILKKEVQGLKQSLQSLNFQNQCQESALRKFANKLQKKNYLIQNYKNPKRHQSLLLSTEGTKLKSEDRTRMKTEVKVQKDQNEQKKIVSIIHSDRIKELKKKLSISKKKDF